MGSGASRKPAIDSQCGSSASASPTLVTHAATDLSKACPPTVRNWDADMDRDVAVKPPVAKPTPEVLPQGVVFNIACGTYEARIRASSGRFVFLGQHDTAAEAHQKYLEAMPIHCPGKKILTPCCLGDLPAVGESASGGAEAKDAATASFSAASTAKGSRIALSVTREISADSDVKALESVQRPKEFQVSVASPFSSGGCLGLQVQNVFGAAPLLVVSVKKGVLLDWNMKNPGLDIRPGDHIVSVNGVTRPFDKMLVAFRSSNTIDLCVKTPREFLITVSKEPGQMLGIDIQHKAGSMLEVKRIEEVSLVKSWNLANPDRVVRLFDCIVATNGVQGDSEDMARTIEFEQHLQLLIRSPPEVARALD